MDQKLKTCRGTVSTETFWLFLPHTQYQYHFHTRSAYINHLLHHVRTEVNATSAIKI